MTPNRWRLTLWLGMFLLVGAFAWSARGALLPFAIGAVFVYVLSPLVDRLAAVVPARSQRADLYRRGAAVMAIYLAFLGAMIAAGIVIVPLAIEQVAQFAETLPELVEDAQLRFAGWLEQYQARVPEAVRERMDEYAQEAGQAAAAAAAGWLRTGLNLLPGTIGLIFALVLVVLWMFYAVRDRHFVANNFRRAVPEEFRPDVENVMLMADKLVGRYIRMQLILGVVVGVAVGVSLTLMGIPLSLALGVFAGITELIPIIGPWIGAVPGLIIVAGTDPGMLPWVALLYFTVQQVENVLLVPRMQSAAVNVHPASIILLLAIAGALFGFVGMVAIIPLVAILREIFWYVDARLDGATPPEALARTNIGRRFLAPQPPEAGAPAADPPTPAPAPAPGPLPPSPPSAPPVGARTEGEPPTR